MYIPEISPLVEQPSSCHPDIMDAFLNDPSRSRAETLPVGK